MRIMHTYAIVALAMAILTGQALAGIIVDVGTGRDGDLIIASGETVTFDASVGATTTSLFMPAQQGDTTLVVDSTAGLGVGDEIMFYVSRDRTDGSTVGSYDYYRIAEIDGDQFLTVNRPLSRAYDSDPANQAVSIQRIPHFRNVTIAGTLRASDFNGVSGGIIYFRTADTLDISGTVSVNAAGFTGGNGGYWWDSKPGMGRYVNSSSASTGVGTGGRGGIDSRGDYGTGGGGGAYYGNGGNGTYRGQPGGTGGSAYFDPTMVDDVIPLGSGGGGGGESHATTGSVRKGGKGGDGAGWVRMTSETLKFTGSVQAKGSNGANGVNETRSGDGGGGAGGFIWLQTYNGLDLTSTSLTAAGGVGGSGQNLGGSGGTGYVRVDYHWGPVPYSAAHEIQMVDAVVPEPMTLSTICLGGLAMAVRRRRA